MYLCAGAIAQILYRSVIRITLYSITFFVTIKRILVNTWAFGHQRHSCFLGQITTEPDRSNEITMGNRSYEMPWQKSPFFKRVTFVTALGGIFIYTHD
jgi:hypothetical protein